MSDYPGALDALATNHQDNVGEKLTAVMVNDIAGAVNAVQAALGIDPQGSFATLVARLAAYSRTCVSVAASDAPAAFKETADYVCDGIDDHVEINAALMDVKGGGRVELAPGTYNGEQIVMQDQTWLRGHGRGSKYTLKDATNADAFVNYVSADGVEANAEFVAITDLMIDGNKANQTSGRGIYFTVNPATSKATNDLYFDPHYLVENVLIYNAKGDGYAATGRSETRLRNVTAAHCDGNGFKPSFDTFLDACTADNSGLAGFDMASSSVRLTCCKAFYSGQVTASSGNGFLIENTHGIVLSGCEAQDNKNCGILLDTSTGCVVQIACDSNSTRSAGTAPAVDIWDGGYHVIDAACVERRADGTNSYQTHALRIRSNSTGSQIRLTHSASGGATISTIIDAGSTDIDGNNLELNGTGSTTLPAYAATVTPDPYVATVHKVGNLTGNITIGAPANKHVGCLLTVVLRQDATGGRTVTWNAVFLNTPTTVTTANGFTVGRFVYDGTNWVGI